MIFRMPLILNEVESAWELRLPSASEPHPELTLEV